MMEVPNFSLLPQSLLHVSPIPSPDLYTDIGSK